jgi:UTP--glucose-1-phosphate uridylyltransferase
VDFSPARCFACRPVGVKFFIMPITKAVIPAAGLGTRMLPAAKAVPKELLPILDRPTIQYVVEEAAAAGIDDVLLVTSPGKPAIEKHFAPDAELVDRLKASGRLTLLQSLQQLAHLKIHSVMQYHQRGLGDAVLQAKASIGNDPFLCLLGDTIFSGSIGPAQQLIEAYDQLGTTVIGVEEVSPDRVDRYGIVGGTAAAPGVFRIETIIEKPTLQTAPSRMAIAARYVLSPRVFAALERVSPGKGGEIQLTDALVLLMEDEPIHAVVLKSRRHDVGNPIDWLATNLLYASHDPAMWEQIKPLLMSLVEK